MSFTVVVIDDKPVIREAIIKTIDWALLNCSVVGEASDGIQGKQIISECKPDIIITDIKMPGLDGLELTLFIKSILPYSKTIIITGYQDFEFAKKAIKLGVFDFILKPIKNEELQKIIHAATNEIKKVLDERDEGKRKTDEIYDLRHQYNNSLPFLRSKKLTDLINGYVENSDHMDIDRLGLCVSRHNTIILRAKSLDVLKISMLFNKAREIVKSVKKTLDIDAVDAVINKDLVFVILYNKTVSVREAQISMRNLCSNIQTRIFYQDNVNYTLSVSSLFKTILDVHISYKEALDVLSINYFKPEDKVLFADSIGKSPVTGVFSIFNDLEEFYNAFLDIENIEFEGQIDFLSKRISDFSNGNIFIAKSLISEVCITASRYYFRLISIKGDIRHNIDEILSVVGSLEDLDQATEYMKRYVCNIKDSLKPKNMNYSPIIKNVIEYIHTSYKNKICLESVGECFDINPTYLSRLLKKETGENFIDILTRVRIDAAKKLLKEPKNRVNGVAEMVGYSDYTYFYQVFKRVEGTSPSEFKKNIDSQKI